MASKATIALILLSKFSLAIPGGSDDPNITSLSYAQESRSDLEPSRTSPTTVHDEVFSLLPLYTLSSATSTQTDQQIMPFSSYPQSQWISPSTPVPANTLTTDVDIPSTMTRTANTVAIRGSPPLPSESTSNPPSQISIGLGPAKSIWSAPTDMIDLSSFHVSRFAGNKENLEFMRSVAPSSNPSTIIQVLFPAGSVDPGRNPQGGAQFYASPINITSAQNVTFQYSAYFPSNFDFVLAGKMPGLYGGHSGCSGGNPAVDCFSTRLMWREGGAGELYLYAPKNKQSERLCKAEGSVCDEVYGFSIGRGSFHWKTGGWTTVKQTVFLNTPGRQDGIFTLDVDGRRVIYRNDILYRDDMKTEKSTGKRKSGKKATTKHAISTKTTARPTTTTGILGLGPLLSGLLGGLRRQVETSINEEIKTPTMTTAESSSSPTSKPAPIPQAPLATQTGIPGPSPEEGKVVRFLGIFFSTFFGGHEDKYATPKDQYVQFKDFALAYNS